MKKYFEICVTWDTAKDGNGYSIFVVANNEEEAVQKTINENMLEHDEHIHFVNYIDEITEDEYHAWTGK